MTIDLRAALAGKPVLVTGAGGFVGRHVLRTGEEFGVRLHAVTRTPTPDLAVPHTAIDLRVADDVRRVVHDVRPSAILHLAAAGVMPGSVGVAEMLDANRRSTESVLAAAAEGGIHVVAAGSGFEYAPLDRPLTEDDETRPVSAYGKAKLEASRRCEAWAVRTPVTLLRLFSVYGPGEPSSRLLPYFFEAARAGRPVDLTAGGQRRDFTFVRDAALAFWHAAAWPPDRGALRVINIGSGEAMTLRDLIERAAALLEMREGIEAVLHFGARPYRDDEMMTYVSNPARCAAVFGWRPDTTIDEGLTGMLAS